MKLNFILSHSVALVFGNWLHQCSQCVDQSLYADMSLKTDVRAANTSNLYEQLKRMQLREFEHIEKEFFNRFFSRTQLGLIAQELQSIAPAAVALIPERRYTSSNGTQVSSKNVLMVRESHVLFILLGGLQEMASRLEAMNDDYWTRAADWDNSLSSVSVQVNQVSSQYSLLDKTVGQTGVKLSFISEQSELLVKNVRLAEDRISDLRGSISALSEKVGEFMVFQKSENEGLKRNFFSLQASSDSHSRKLHDVAEIVRDLVIRMEGLTNRVSRLERGLFNLINERAFLIQEAKNGEKNRNFFVRSLLQLERLKSQRLADAKTIQSDLATRREQFDKQLILLKEEADLRVLGEKSRMELEAQERALKFEREKLNVDMAIRIEEARIESEMRLRDKRENEDVNLRELAEKNLAEKNKLSALIQQTAEIVTRWVRDLYSSPDTLLLVIGSILSIVAGMYIAKEGAQLAREEIGRRMGKPELVRVTSKKNFLSSFLFDRKNFDSKNAFSDVVLPEDLSSQIRRLAVATRAARLSKNPLLNMMFYGEPGTGKTMVAKRFAEFSGLDYAIMSGGDIAPLGANAVTEIHKLFKWVQSSRKGVVLFIDEAESFLTQRTGGMSENLRNAITALLFHTGTASNKFMMIIATNRPGDLDTAILDRIDERIEFPLPNLRERESLVEMYFFRYVAKKIEEEKVRDELGIVAKKTRGFSGREISKLMMAVHSHQFFDAQEGKGSLIELLKSVTDSKVKEHEKIRRISASGYAFDESTLDSSDRE